jgi:two-component system chemotaxis response regulator CheY
MRILIVDDSVAMRRMEKNILSDLGFTDVSEAADGLEALQLLAAERFEMVLMDWKMPVLSGLETLKQIKTNPDLEALPVIMVTSESQKPKILEAIKAGAANYIIKPFDAPLLKEKLGPFLKKAAV